MISRAARVTNGHRLDLRNLQSAWRGIPLLKPQSKPVGPTMTAVFISLFMYLFIMHICTYMYLCAHTYVRIYIYTHTFLDMTIYMDG